MIRNARFLLSTILLLVLPAGAETVRITTKVISSLAHTAENDPELEFGEVQSAIGQGVFDGRANTLLKASETFTAKIFNLPELAKDRAITFHAPEGDCMIVSWTFMGEGGEANVILNDTPRWSIYHFRFPPERLSSPQAVADFLTELIVWENSPLGFQHFSVGVGLRNGVGFDFASEPLVGRLRTANGGVAYARISGASRKSGTYLTARISKYYTAATYPVPPFVPERVPPLEERIASWDYWKIRGEIGRVFPEIDVAPAQSTRDRILIRELVRRGMSREEFVDLLRERGRDQLDLRAGIVFGEYSLQGKSADLDSYLKPALELYRSIGPAAEDAIDSVLKIAGAYCAPNIEDEALALFREGRFQRPVVRYFTRCSSSETVAAALRTGSPEVTSRELTDALEHIQRRILKGSGQ